MKFPPWLGLLLTSVCSAFSESIPLFNGQDLSGWTVHSRMADQDRARGYWQVRDGAIECHTAGDKKHPYVWLVHEGEFDDFELTLEVQSFGGSTGNSGVQLRSRWAHAPEAGGERAKGWLDGPQVDLHPKGPWRCGFIYDETEEARRWIFPSKPSWKLTQAEAEALVPGWRWVHADGSVAAAKGLNWDPPSTWNRVRIRCEGLRIQTWINEVPVADYDGTGVLDDAAHRTANVGRTGHIALQLHGGDDLRIRFRNLTLDSLP